MEQPIGLEGTHVCAPGGVGCSARASAHPLRAPGTVIHARRGRNSTADEAALALLVAHGAEGALH
eukprot:6796570-Alexandrium_andersonii.AAC.1